MILLLTLYVFFRSTGLAAFWGVIAIGLFADGENLLSLTHGRPGLFKGLFVLPTYSRSVSLIICHVTSPDHFVDIPHEKKKGFYVLYCNT
jgi:hypothetical protein